MANSPENQSERTTDWGIRPPPQRRDDTSQVQDSPIETGIYPFAQSAQPVAVHRNLEGGEHPKAFGRYEVRSVVGKGGFGTVYVGHDMQLDRKVAVKVPHGTPSEEECQAFLKEARRLAQLRHPGIVTVHDIGVQDRHIYIVTDFLEGISLKERIKQRPPTWQEAAEIVARVADALAHAHSQRIVHRDVKPANILMTADDRPVLLDFGLGLSESEMVGQDQRIMGTPAFMSPEQALGTAHRIDGRTDIYSLGVVLYRLLTGRLPFFSESVQEILRRIVEDRPQPPRQLVPSLPAELERICLKAMAQRVEDRYTTALDLAADLRRAHEVRTEQVQDAPEASGITLRKPVAPQRLAIEPERRRITLLVCNCESADPQKPLESLDPEEQHAVQTEFHRRVAETVAEHHGTLLPSATREVVVCFGFPVAHEDAAVQAIHTGLALLKRFGAEPRFKGGVPLTAWAAVHTGQAVVGEGDATKGETVSIVGEARTVIARLEPFAEPGILLATEATQRLTRGYFVCESLGKRTVKGVAQPLAMFRVLRESAARHRLDVSEQTGLTPLVGRDTELSILRDRWEQTAEGMGQVVLLIGEAGLGKSRLVRELKTHVHEGEDPDDLLAIEWRCSPYHQSSSLYPPTDFLERLLHFQHDVAPAERFGRLAAHLREIGLGEPETVALFAALLSLPLEAGHPPLNLSPQRLREKTAEALLEWLRACARRRPVLFIVEDLHWIDPSSLELLGTLVEQRPSVSILTVLTFRPEFETPWKSKAHQTQIALNRLTKRQIGDMLRKKIGRERVPQSVIDEVAAKTDGIPLFVEEYAKVLAEAPAVQDAEGDSTASAILRLQEIPATLEDLLMARLDRMSSNREVVQVGATLGREFGHELLRAVCSLNEAALQAELDKLVRAEMLFQKGRWPQCSYVFKHALIQDAAYQSMLKVKRQQHHRKIAEVMAAQFPEIAAAQPDLVAQHFTEAGMAPEAIDWWSRAGQRSAERSALVEAIRQLTRALELLETLEPAPQRDGLELTIRLPLSACYIGARGYGSPDVERQTDRARQLCERLGDQAPLFPVLMVIWALNFIRGKLERAQELSRELLALAEKKADDGCRTEAHWSGTCTGWWAGEFALARQHAEKGCALWRQESSVAFARFTQQNSGPLTTAYLGLSLWALGYPEQAQKKMEEALALAETLKHPFTTAVTLWKPGMMTQLAGDAAATRAWGERVLKISEEQGFAFWVALGIGLKGAALTLEGQHAEAIPLLRDAITRMEATGCEKVHQSQLYFLAESLWRVGQRTEAWKILDRAFAINDRDRERYLEAELYRRKAAFLAEESPGDTAAIEACLQMALQVAGRQQARFFELRAALALARLWQATGRTAEARDMFRTRVEWFVEGKNTTELMQAQEYLRSL